jgi:integrase
MRAAEMIRNGEFRLNEEDPPFHHLYVEYWTNRADLSPKYKRDDFRFNEKYLQDAPELQCRTSRLAAYQFNRLIDRLERSGTTPRMTNRILQNAKTFITWAKRRGYIAQNFSDEIERKKEGLQERGFFTLQEVIRLPAWSFPIFASSARCSWVAWGGLRRGEIMALRWMDVDFEQGVIHIRRNYTGDRDQSGNPVFRQPKMGSTGTIPVLHVPELRRVLADVLAETPFKEPRHLVLQNTWERRRSNAATSDGETPLSDSSLKRGFAEICMAIGISPDQIKERRLTFHSTRHAFITHMSAHARAGIVRQFSRQSSEKMVEHYQHRDGEAMLDAVDSFNRGLDVYRERPAV